MNLTQEQMASGTIRKAPHRWHKGTKRRRDIGKLIKRQARGAPGRRNFCVNRSTMGAVIREAVMNAATLHGGPPARFKKDAIELMHELLETMVAQDTVPAAVLVRMHGRKKLVPAYQRFAYRMADGELAQHFVEVDHPETGAPLNALVGAWTPDLEVKQPRIADE